jgi:predicted  nucleic acid-binding Zn-ribbon protein
MGPLPKPITVIVEQGDTIVSLQNIAERQAMRIDDLRDKRKSLKESMRSFLENDNEYSTQQESVKEVSKKLKERKGSLTQSPEYRELSAKEAEMKDEQKELEESLGGHLLSIFKQTGAKVFDMSNGSQREFSIVARIKPKQLSLLED